MSENPKLTVVEMRRNAAEGFDSIGAVATQKVHSTSLNLGMPSAYQSVYAAHRRPTRYFPEPRMPRPYIWAGEGLQSDWHQQKKADADAMVMAKVKATQQSRVRVASTPHGRGFIPNAVLGQRQTANQSLGSYYAYSARNDVGRGLDGYGGSLSGGVLRSAEGQAYAEKLLMRRIQQLNQIEAEGQNFNGITIPQFQNIRESRAALDTQMGASEGSQIELNLLLQSIINSLYAGTGDSEEPLTRFTMGDATTALMLMFRIVPTADVEVMEDLVAKVDNILQLVDGIVTDRAEVPTKDSVTRQTALTIQTLFTKARTYLQRMMGGVATERMVPQYNPNTGRQELVRTVTQEQGQFLSPKERIALSKTLVKDLGFSKMLVFGANPSAQLRSAARNGLFNGQERQTYRTHGYSDSEGDSDSDFDRPARPREDAAHARETGMPRQPRAGFSIDERDIFGYDSGAFYGPSVRGPAAFVGEESAAPVLRVEEIEAQPEFEEEEMPLDQQRRQLDIHSRYDPDTQGFNVGTALEEAAPAPTSASAAAATIGGPRRRKLNPAAIEPATGLPVGFSRYDLPSTREGLLALKEQIEANGGPSIRIYGSSSAANIRKNFIKRLGL